MIKVKTGYDYSKKPFVFSRYVIKLFVPINGRYVVESPDKYVKSVERIRDKNKKIDIISFDAPEKTIFKFLEYGKIRYYILVNNVLDYYFDYDIKKKIVLDLVIANKHIRGWINYHLITFPDGSVYEDVDDNTIVFTAPILPKTFRYKEIDNLVKYVESLIKKHEVVK